ncbi:MAG TPA: NADP-dependent oxidoreductase [Verrucomicrobiae bacterium]|nr:NADP-dependent oxidoreductase [Verrucomicrobiae bacterium]
MTSQNRRFVLRQRPTGDFDPKVLERVVGPAPVPGPGQALVKLSHLSLDPTNRIWMGEEPSYLPPVPLDGVMRGVGLGEVVASNSSQYKVGRKVVGLLGWQDYAVISPDDATPATALPPFPPLPPEHVMGVLGATGMTAYFGLLDIGKPKRGETVVVSAAAGAVGSIVGQLAKVHGCRAVGIAGTREKCEWLTRELGFDAAICRRDADWKAQLKAACPNGVDIDFENAGGEIMDEVIELMNLHGRVVLCGMISQYGKDDRSGIGPTNFIHVLTRRLKIEGFIILDYVKRFPLAQLRMMWWMKTGRVKDAHTLVRGLDNAPQALVGLFKGENTGKLIVEV